MTLSLSSPSSVPRLILLLSGNIAVGKSALVAALCERFQFSAVRTRSLLDTYRSAHNPTSVEAGRSGSAAIMIESKPPSGADRLGYQELGDAVDHKTGGAWIRDGVRALDGNVATAVVGEWGTTDRLVVDCVRTREQIVAMRQFYGRHVVHLHLHASESVREQRYVRRRTEQLLSGAAHIDAMGMEGYRAAAANSTEAAVPLLAAAADIVVNTDNSSEADVLERVAGALRLYGRGAERLVDVLVGGCWGSEGKGQVSAYLAGEYDLLMRVGGPNAGHKVYELDQHGKGTNYCFYHLPSGTRCNSRAKVLLGAGAVLGLPKLLEEIADCGLTGERLSIDPQAMVIESGDIVYESGLVASIGSTGQGVGAATVRKALRGSHIVPVRLAKDIDILRPFIRDAQGVLAQHYAQGKKVFLEGTQGTQLSLHHGAYPYVTSRDTTVAGTMSDAGIGPGRINRSIMVVRSFPIRVQSPAGGSSGPMGVDGGVELSWSAVGERSGHDGEELRLKEKTSTTKRDRRVAEFCWPSFRRALMLNAPTDIALTFVDYFGRENREARRYEQLNDRAQRFIEELERHSGVGVSLAATRFHFRSIIDRRGW